MERSYNHIYKKLVEDENDLIGHIAYSIYKANKIEFIEKFKEEHGKLPSEDEIKPFHDFSCTESTISLYKMKSEAIVYDFIEEVQNGYKKDMEEDYIHKQNQHLAGIIEPLKPMDKKKQFWRGVWQSAVGSFFLMLALAALMFFFIMSSHEYTFTIGNGGVKKIQEKEVQVPPSSEPNTEEFNLENTQTSN